MTDLDGPDRALREEHLRQLLEVGLQLTSERDPVRLLQAACVAARELLGARFCALGVLDDDQRWLREYVTCGQSAAVADPTANPDPGRGVLGRVLQGRGSRGRGGPEDLSLVNRATTYLVVPLRSLGGVCGWVCLLDKEDGDDFNARDEWAAGHLAAQVAGLYDSAERTAVLLRRASERERQAARMREHEGLFQSAFEHTHVAMVLTDLDHHFVRTNAAFARMFGYTEEEVLGLTMGEITHPDHLAESYGRREDLLSGERRFFQMEKRYLHKDGRVLWGLTNVSLIRDRAGTPLLYVGQVQDITQRKQLEAQFHEAKVRLEHVVTSSPSVLFTLAVEGNALRPTWVSANLCEMLGYAPDCIYQPLWWEEGLHPDDRHRTQTETWASLQASGQVADEFRFRRQDGTYAWIRSELRLLRDAEGRPNEVVGSWSEITERKRLEEQFRQSQKMEAVGRLAGGVAHDFNNLLCVINGYGELLLRTLPMGDPRREPVSEMAAAGSRAAALTRQLLAFSRKAIIAPRVLDLRAVASEMDRMLRRVIGEDIELAMVAPSDLGTVKVDPSQIEQVIVNLAVNARDAMPKGGKLTLELNNAEADADYVRDHPGMEPGRYVRLAVSDTGCGMDAETRAHIWEPFFTTKGERGTGLGLATVYGIVKQSGGHVTVYSEVGVGTTFMIYLPRADAPAHAKRSAPAADALASGDETILLVEDEAGLRGLVSLVLRECGYTVLEAKNGHEALRLAEEHGGRFDLMITDVVMPQISGSELAARIRAQHPAVRTLFVSGYTDDAVVRHGILQAEVEFLQKPFYPAVLAQKVRDVLDR